MSDFEIKRLELQKNLDAERSTKRRNELGQFSTPTKLAVAVLREAKRLLASQRPVRFLDPAIGTGSFYSALLDVFPKEDIVSARGFEIDPHYGIPAIELWSETDLQIDIADFTTVIPSAREKPNLIICNPPYVRHHHLSVAEKKRLSSASALAASVAVGGLAGLYCYFMLIAHQWLADGGIAGWLIPSEFMDVNYGAAVRRYLTQEVKLLGIHRFDPADQQFDDALVSSAVIWIQKGKPTTAERLASFSYGGTFEEPRVTRQIPLAELSRSQKWSGLVFCAKEEATHTHTIGDFFFIKRGLATGNNSFFVVSEAKALALGISDRFLQPVLPSPRNLEQDIVEADERGKPLIQERRFLINCRLGEEELRKVNPALADYFDSGRSIATDTYICRHRTPWFSQENRPAAPIVCTYMGRNLNNREKPFRFILNHSDATALNVYLMLYPKGFLAQALELNPNLINEVWKVLSFMDAKALLDEGRVYGGGLYKLEPRELANAPADELYKIISATLGNQLGQLQIFGQRVA